MGADDDRRGADPAQAHTSGECRTLAETTDPRPRAEISDREPQHIRGVVAGILAGLGLRLARRRRGEGGPR